MIRSHPHWFESAQWTYHLPRSNDFSMVLMRVTLGLSIQRSLTTNRTLCEVVLSVRIRKQMRGHGYFGWPIHCCRWLEPIIKSLGTESHGYMVAGGDQFCPLPRAEIHRGHPRSPLLTPFHV
ncbi:hypothetical protein H5410_050534 [Solanum commersonii]|uniref:Uncharacterized protein n=1 Tax=Solanum commersonii TaxID=4109 RepID=A0A9J5WVR1_SOLCO|nr:hypothetical protein H5410_050534 [Solanum commersonii]